MLETKLVFHGWEDAAQNANIAEKGRRICVMEQCGDKSSWLGVDTLVIRKTEGLRSIVLQVPPFVSPFPNTTPLCKQHLFSVQV